MKNYQPKPLFIKRMEILLDNNEDLEKFLETSKTQPKKSIRINTLKISSKELISKLKNKGWNLSQPFSDHPEILIINNILEPGELGKTTEHLLGYYYAQEITSMMPILALSPCENDNLLDLCAAPGSKTTQAAALMNNKGTIIANDLSLGRIKILSANLERFGITNTIITRHKGSELCNKLKNLGFQFNKILVDAPCSGEGNIRTSPRTFLEWSESLLKSLSKKQKKLASSALELLKPGGEMIYSTCTYAPEENELVIQHLLDNFNIEILPINLPLKTRKGITTWKNKSLNKQLKNCIRIYHHDNDTEGFFLCKMRKMGE
jgi:NOL1/NOP2/sun family putative RNA methylase